MLIPNTKYLTKQILSTAKDYELERSSIDVGEIIGEGQFGDVHTGMYRARDGSNVPVAIKTCKVESEGTMAEKFLEEACELCILCGDLLCNISLYDDGPLIEG